MILQGFIIKNPNGIIFASFVDRGLAMIFCHSQGYPVVWIQEAEIEIKNIKVAQAACLSQGVRQ